VDEIIHNRSTGKRQEFPAIDLWKSRRKVMTRKGRLFYPRFPQGQLQQQQF
jgi:hypothetical protein